MNAIICGFCASTAERVENFCQVCGAPSPSFQKNTAAGTCRACDGALKAGSNFCFTCGTQSFGSTVGMTTSSRGDVTKTKLSPLGVEKPVQVSSPVVQLLTAKQDYPSSEEVQPSQFTKPKKKLKKLVRILMIVGLGLVGGVIYHFVKDKPVPPKPIAATPTAQQAPKSSTSAPAVVPAPPAKGQQPEPLETQMRTLGSSQVPGPSFDCSAARATAEKMICGSLSLSIVDRNLAFLYKNIRAVSADPDGLRAEQNQWIRDRNRCKTEACLTDMYETRISQLEIKFSGR